MSDDEIRRSDEIRRRRAEQNHAYAAGKRDPMLEDITSLNEAAVSLHELFISLVAAGFTEDQALKLLAVMYQQNAREQSSGNDDS